MLDFPHPILAQQPFVQARDYQQREFHTLPPSQHEQYSPPLVTTIAICNLKESDKRLKNSMETPHAMPTTNVKFHRD